MRIEYSGICDKGMARAMNQDAIFMGAQGEMALFAVADGMGGHLRGEAASGTVIAEIKEWWETLLAGGCEGSFADMVFSLERRLERANRIIFENYNHAGVCGSTVVTLLIYRQDYCVISSGDSRAYHLNRREWGQLTEDDVWENLPEIRRDYSHEQQRRHENYGKLTQAIGISLRVEMRWKTGVLKEKDRFLLCSDGFYKVCGEKAVRELLKGYRGKKNGDKLLSRVLRKAYDNGAKDNLSIILVKWRR